MPERHVKECWRSEKEDFPPIGREIRLMLIEITLDRPLGRLFKFFLENLEVGDLAIGRELRIQLLYILPHLLLDLLHAHPLARGILDVGIYKSYEFIVFVYDERFGHVWHVVEHLLDFFGIDILA